MGWYCRKSNDGKWPTDFAVRLTFQGDDGPVFIAPADLRESPVLQETRGVEYVIWDTLDRPMSYEQIA